MRILNYTLLSVIGFITSGCFDMGGFMSQSASSGATSYQVITVTPTSDENGVVSANITPNSSSTQSLSASSSSNISGSSVDFPPGSLQIPTNITIEEGSSIASTSTASQVGVSSATSVTSASSPVVVSSGSSSDASVPFLINIPVLAALHLNLTEVKTLVVFYQIKKYSEGGKTYYGMYKPGEYTLKNGKVSISTKYFGSYQLAYIDVPEESIAVVEKETTETITTKAQETNSTDTNTSTTTSSSTISITGYNITEGSTNVALDQVVSVSFSDSLDVTTIFDPFTQQQGPGGPPSIALRFVTGNGGTSAPISFQTSNTVAEMDFSSPGLGLPLNSKLQYMVAGNIKSVDGATLSTSEYILGPSFTTQEGAWTSGNAPGFSGSTLISSDSSEFGNVVLAAVSGNTLNIALYNQGPDGTALTATHSVAAPTQLVAKMLDRDQFIVFWKESAAVNYITGFFNPGNNSVTLSAEGSLDTDLGLSVENVNSLVVNTNQENESVIIAGRTTSTRIFASEYYYDQTNNQVTNNVLLLEAPTVTTVPADAISEPIINVAYDETIMAPRLMVSAVLQSSTDGDKLRVYYNSAAHGNLTASTDVVSGSYGQLAEHQIYLWEDNVAYATVIVGGIIKGYKWQGTSFTYDSGTTFAGSMPGNLKMAADPQVQGQFVLVWNDNAIVYAQLVGPYNSNTVSIYNGTANQGEITASINQETAVISFNTSSYIKLSTMSLTRDFTLSSDNITGEILSLSTTTHASNAIIGHHRDASGNAVIIFNDNNGSDNCKAIRYKMYADGMQANTSVGTSMACASSAISLNKGYVNMFVMPTGGGALTHHKFN